MRLEQQKTFQISLRGRFLTSYKKAVAAVAVVFTLAQANNVFAYGVGLSTFPLSEGTKAVSAEATGVVTRGGGAGIQARYSQKLNNITTVDAGFGISGGERSGRVFAGMDYEILPDYEKQPRMSLKAIIQNSKDFGASNNSFSLAPTFSKGLNVQGKEVYPYLAIPYGVMLNSDSKTYETTLNLALGANGHLPIEGYERWIANVEVTANLQDSYSGVFVGLSYPIN